jgi:hypothetical protein
MKYIIIILLSLLALISFASVTFFFGPGLPLGGFFLCIAILYYFKKFKPNTLKNYFKIATIIIGVGCFAVTIFLLSDYLENDYPNSGFHTLLNPPTNFMECIEKNGKYLEDKSTNPNVRCEFKDKVYYK